ncbi:MAG: hydantoinase/oxoprolinase family protein [Janthinobacterium lividum]
MSHFVMAMDVGGTFLDTVVLDDAGLVTTTKVFSSHDDYSRCIRQAVEKVSNLLGLSPSDFLKKCRLVINGTTVATNVLAELKGPPVGLITTAGFGDTLYIARMQRWGSLDFKELKPLPQIVPRERIYELKERVNAKGEAIVVPTVEQVREALVDLVERRGAQALAVSFLWSFANPAHEQLVRRVAGEMYPDVPVSLSSEVFPTIREYERTNTTVIDAFIAPGVRKYVADLEGYYAAEGFDGALRMVHGAGGVASPAEIRRSPVSLINSGPVAGYVGAMKFGEAIGRRNIITADVGGTSFDAGLIDDGKLSLKHRTMVPAPGHASDGYLTGLSLMDVTAIGTGGGSIGWIDLRGVIRVGPHSAGSYPGPACFGRGGIRPTLTDACLILGLLGSDAFLGGTFQLDKQAAVEALRTLCDEHSFADEFEVAAAMYRLGVADMANNVHHVSLNKGRDPRKFSMFSYGGAGGLFLAATCEQAQVAEMVVPENCAVFSAFGALMSDYRRSGLRSCPWKAGSELGRVREAFEELEERIIGEVLDAGFERADIQLERTADMRFKGQAMELTVPLPNGEVAGDFGERSVANFKDVYADQFGSGSLWLNAPAEIINVRVSAIVATRAYVPRRTEPATIIKAETEQRSREVYWPYTGKRELWPRYVRRALESGRKIEGPGIIESDDTTIIVPPGASAEIDSLRNVIISFPKSEDVDHASSH